MKSRVEKARKPAMPPIIIHDRDTVAQPAVPTDGHASAIALYGQALQLYRDRNLAEAVKTMRQAVKIDPGIDEEGRLGYWQEELDDVRLKIRNLNRKISKRPDDAKSHYELAHNLRLIGKRKDAENEWRKVIEVDEGNWGKSAQKMLDKYLLQRG